MLIRCVKILAVGCYKRFATFEIDDKSYTCFISDEMYGALKKKGIPTSQKLSSERKKILCH